MNINKIITKQWYKNVISKARLRYIIYIGYVEKYKKSKCSII